MIPCITSTFTRRCELLIGGRIEVTGGALLLLAWLNYCDTQNLLPLVLCAATAHELGHLAAIYGLGGSVDRLRLTAAGAELRLNGTLSYGRDVLCAVAGPLVNFLLAFWAAELGADVFAGLNLALGGFNLLPVGALDGGRIVSCLGAWSLGLQRSDRLLRWVERAVVAGLLLCGGVAVWNGGNITLLLVAVWLFVQTKKS